MTNLLILATSGNDPPYVTRRQGCWDSWLQDLPRLSPPHQFRFVLADPEFFTEHDDPILHQLTLPISPAYDYLPLRTQSMLLWALTKPLWDYVFKCDDDTYVHLDRLIQYADTELAGRDYVGATPWGSEKNGLCASRLYGSGGAGYFLSRKAAGLVSVHLQRPIGAEDLLVGRILADNGIPFYQESRLRPFGDLHPGASPAPDNNLITAHYLSPDKMQLVHKRFAAPPTL